jgi:predicted MFS family arabinose efflux permease
MGAAMTDVRATPDEREQLDAQRLRRLTLVLAIACGLAVANIYYAQPLLGELARSFGVGEGSAALVVTLTQIGYAAGLLFVVPLGDLVENKALTIRVLVGTAAALSVAAAAPSLGVFLVAALVVGLTSVVAQVLVPVAAHFAPEGRHGAVVGRVMSGLLLGILLARTVSSLVAAAFGWRTVYAASAVLMLALTLVLARVLPQRRPIGGVRYTALLRSMARLLRTEPVLRRRMAYQAAMFAVFSAFWTSIAYELQQHHHLTQTGIGLFALVGAGGAAAAPVAGRLGDRGHIRIATGAAIVLGSAAMVLAACASASVVALAAAGVLMDLAVQGNHVLGQRAIYAARPDARARMNGVYMASIFGAGAVGSAVSGVLYGTVGWTGVAIFAAVVPLLALAVWVAAPAD